MIDHRLCDPLYVEAQELLSLMELISVVASTQSIKRSFTGVETFSRLHQVKQLLLTSKCSCEHLAVSFQSVNCPKHDP